MLRRLVNLPFTMASKAAKAFQDREDQKTKEKYNTAFDPGTVPVNREATLDNAVAGADASGTDLAMSAAEVMAATKKRPIAFVDVRDATGWAAGHLRGAVHMPMHEVGVRVSELPWDQLVVAYCDDGTASKQAVAFFRERGMEDTVVLAGGLAAWKLSGGEVVS
jgi:rhodanese-related sulfurtransferase